MPRLTTISAPNCQEQGGMRRAPTDQICLETLDIQGGATPGTWLFSSNIELV